MKHILNKSYEYAKKFSNQGKAVDYIPGLEKKNIQHLAACVIDKDKNFYKIGFYDEKFHIMSIAKIILYLIVLENYSSEEIKNT